MSSDLLSRLQAAKTDEERDWIVLEFSLENLEKEIQDAVWAAAIPHWFDESFLAALLQKPLDEVKKIYSRLQNLSFVESFPSRGHNIHERTRKSLLKHLWEDDAEKYRELSQRAAKYSADQHQEDVGWRVEWVYHLLIADPDDGADQIQSVCWGWNNSPIYAYEKVEEMANVAEEHANYMRLSPRCLAWVRFWKAMVHLDYFRAKSAKDVLYQIDVINDDKRLVAEVNIRLGDAHAGLAEYQEARNCYEKALPICREIEYSLGEANCTVSLGSAFYRLGQYEEARKNYELALQLYVGLGNRHGEAHATAALGAVYRDLRKDEEARKCYEGALQIYIKIGSKLGESNCLFSLGGVHYDLQQHEEARRYFEESLRLSTEVGDKLGEANSIKSLGDIDIRLGQNENARKRYEDAQAIYRAIGNQHGDANCLLGIGDLDRLSKRWGAAEENYRSALGYYSEAGLNFNVVVSLQRLGLTAEGNNDFDSARNYYQEALKISNVIGSPIADDIQRRLDFLSINSDKKSNQSKKSTNKKSANRQTKNNKKPRSK